MFKRTKENRCFRKFLCHCFAFGLRNDNSGFVLLMSLVIMIFLSILLGAAFLRSNSHLQQADQRRSISEAFYAAEAGIDRAVFELRRNPTWRPGVGTEPAMTNIPVTNQANVTIGTYSVNVTDIGNINGFNTVLVRSDGLDSLSGLRRSIEANVITDNPARFLISTLGDLRLTSGADIQADVLGKDIFFDLNPGLPVGDLNRKIKIDADVYFIQSIGGKQQPNQFAPPVDVTIDDHDGTANDDWIKTPSITFAGVDLERYRQLSSTLDDTCEALIVPAGGTVDLEDLPLCNGNQAQPILIFSEGDINVRGEYSHSLSVVAGGNINIMGSIRSNINATDPAGSGPPQIGLFSENDVYISSSVQTDGSAKDLTLEAFIIADGEHSYGSFVAQGPKLALGKLHFTGSISVKGKNSGQSAVDLNAFKSRDYQHNPEFNTNRKIPFSPFIANIVAWREVP